MKIMVSIFKSPKIDGMYVYVSRQDGIKKIPEALLVKFGTPIHVSDMILTQERKLARAEAPRVLQQIEEVGFYLQMPPKREDYLLSLFKDTSDRYKGMA